MRTHLSRPERIHDNTEQLILSLTTNKPFIRVGYENSNATNIIPANIDPLAAAQVPINTFIPTGVNAVGPGILQQQGTGLSIAGAGNIVIGETGVYSLSWSAVAQITGAGLFETFVGFLVINYPGVGMSTILNNTRASNTTMIDGTTYLSSLMVFSGSSVDLLQAGDTIGLYMFGLNSLGGGIGTPILLNQAMISVAKI